MPVCAAAVGRAGHVLPGARTDPTDAARDRRPPDRQDADDRGLLLQALDRPAVHVPAATGSTTSANFLHMMFATPCEDYDVDPVLARALDLLLILHADHEQNCSTSTVRMVGSSQRQPVRQHLGRHQRAVGPAPRRRQPAGDRDAGAHRGRGRRRAEVRGPRQGQEGQQPPHGLRAPRLQELRPAGRDPQEGVHRRAQRGWASRAGSSRSR